MTVAPVDLRGYPVSGASPRALELYESALGTLLLARGDALPLCRRSLADSTGFVAAREMAATLLLYSRDPRDYEAGKAACDELMALPMSRRERAHATALRLAAAGDYRAARAQYERIVIDTPRDAVALWASQLIDYYVGEPQALRVRAERALPAWSDAVPGYHAVLAMLAFGLEECGEYAAAEDFARRALALEPLDRRALHALLHVFEMQGRAEEGVRVLLSQDRRLPLANHLWWHLALFELHAHGPSAALEVYERRMRLDGLSDLIDASALLWRIALSGADMEAWFAALAGRWAPHAEDAYCAFNDLHAVMAFVGAGQWTMAERVLAAQERRVVPATGINYDMTRSVGLPACRAIIAFGRGDYVLAERLLRGLPPVAHRIGGSHAQRDVLQLTRAAAAAAARRCLPLRRGFAGPRSAPRSAGAWQRAAPAAIR